MQIVIDTNVFVSALKSKKGASYKLLSLLNKKDFQINISVPVILKYEYALKQHIGKGPISKKDDIDIILDYICSIANHKKVYFLWRSILKDPKDDMLLELAVSSNSKYIITYNIKHFKGVEKFGLTAITPKDFLKK